MTFAVTFYDVSVWLHVSAVVVGFGATFAESITFPVAMKMDVRHLPYLHKLGSPSTSGWPRRRWP